jgi:hypothetical protein
MINYIFKDKVSPLYVDKFSATLAVDLSHESQIIQNIKMLEDNGFAKKGIKGLGNYKVSVEVFKEAYIGGKLLVQCSPKSIKNSFFRIEFNPAKVDMSEGRAFIDAILPMGYDGLVNQGICTRIDATVDVKNEDLSKLLIYHPGISITSDHYKSGCIETLYFGSKSSQKLICVYDKVADIKHKNSQLIFKIPMPDYPVTRIEARLRKRVPVKDLAELPNLFKKLCISSFHNFPKLDDLFTMFLMASQGSNAQNALLALKEPARKKHQKYLDTYSAKWWKPDEIWQQWPAVIDSLLNPPKSNFKPLFNGKLAVAVGG